MTTKDYVIGGVILALMCALGFQECRVRKAVANAVKEQQFTDSIKAVNRDLERNMARRDSSLVLMRDSLNSVVGSFKNVDTVILRNKNKYDAKIIRAYNLSDADAYKLWSESANR